MPKNQIPLTAARLRELLSYDPETGIFRRLVSTSRNAKAGDVAGGLNSEGYVRISVDGRSYRAHRLAWFYVHGTWPADQLDHRNGVRTDNWIKNLREATNAQNQQNYGIPKHNRSGHVGVSWHKGHRKWLARIKLGGHQRYIGSFKDISDAVTAYAAAKEKLHQYNPTVRENQK